MISPRVMRALGAPMLSHLDPEFLAIMDDTRARLGRVCHAPDGALALAVSGTGTTAMETAVANLVAPGTRVLSIVTGYFADRLAEICRRYGADVRRIDVEWGRAADPDVVRRELAEARADIVTVVHAETSTGVLNPVKEIAAAAREVDALTIVDAVTSLGAMPLDVAGWQLDAVYSCSQKGVGAPSGVAPLVLTPRALARRVPCRSFALDLTLLEDYWLRRKYHHTMCASLIYALREALAAIEEEGLPARWARHERHHQLLAKRTRSSGAVAPATTGRTAVDAERGSGAGRRRRGGGAASVAPAIQHRDWRRPRTARRPDLAHRPDGREFDRSAGDTVSLGADPIDAHLGSFRRFSVGLRSSRRGTRVATSCASGKSIRSRDVLPVLLERS